MGCGFYVLPFIVTGEGRGPILWAVGFMSCPSLSQVRARDLFYGLWVNDLFMRRVEANAEWSLFCPNEAPGLAECWGEAFDALYQKFEREGRAKRVIKAQQLWFAILETQVSETCFLMHLFLRHIPEVQMPRVPSVHCDCLQECRHAMQQHSLQHCTEDRAV